MAESERERRLRTQGSLVSIDEAPKISPQAAAFRRKMGMYVDPISVAGVDDGLLSARQARDLREAGILVLDSEITDAPDDPPPD